MQPGAASGAAPGRGKGVALNGTRPSCTLRASSSRRPVRPRPAKIADPREVSRPFQEPGLIRVPRTIPKPRPVDRPWPRLRPQGQAGAELLVRPVAAHRQPDTAADKTAATRPDQAELSPYPTHLPDPRSSRPQFLTGRWPRQESADNVAIASGVRVSPGLQAIGTKRGFNAQMAVAFRRRFS